MFLCEGEEFNGQTMIYYDSHGRRFKRPVDRRLLDVVLKKLDGKPKAVVRSSGGLILVSPLTLIIYHRFPEAFDKKPEIRIRVRFRDFTGPEGPPGFCRVLTKDVLPEELEEGFSVELSNTQRFIVDFGSGPIPIFVFGCAQIGEESMACFIEWTDWEMITHGGGGNLIQRFRIPKDTLRFAPDYQTIHAAMVNYVRLKRSGADPIPENLKLGFRIDGPIGISTARLREHLAKTLHGKSEDTRDLDEFFRFMEKI